MSAPPIGEAAVAKYRFEKLFDSREADELIPTLEVLIRELQVNATELRRAIAEVLKADPEAEALELPAIISRYPELRAPSSKLAQLTRKIESFGCILKDIDQGLIDFPFEIDDDEVVFLCWQFGEPRVLAWHPVDGGFAERKPLPGAAKPLLN
jgi:hypothetical protein